MKSKISTILLLLLVLEACYTQPTVTLKAYFDAHNKARTNPGYYSTFIANEFTSKTTSTLNSDGTTYTTLHSGWRLRFNEKSPDVFNEAVRALNAQTPLAPLKMDLGMTFSVYKHVKWLADTYKSLSHTGDGGSTPSQRAQPYTSGFSGMYENILYTGVSAYTGEHLVSQYIIDDGVPNRGHRTNIFTSGQTLIGVGIAYDFVQKRLYHGSVMANSYNCDKCNLITCAEQLESGWTQYLIDSGLPNPCASGSTPTNTTTPTPTPTPTNTTNTTTPTPTPTPTPAPTTPGSVVVTPWPTNLPTIKQYLDAQNKARTDPKYFASYITTKIANVANLATNVHPGWGLKFNEPVSNLTTNATSFLNTAAALTPLVPDLGLTFAAWSQANYCATVLKAQSFTGPDGSNTRTRAQAYASGTISFVTENMLSTFVSVWTPEDYVTSFLLDDGLLSRARRANVFNPNFKFVGVGLAKDSTSATNRYYVSEVLATNYVCDKCSLITCQQQADCGWRQYLLDAGLPDPCRV